MTRKTTSRFQPRTDYTTVKGVGASGRLPRLGKIRLGVKVKKKAADSRCTHKQEEVCFYCTYPKDVDYFVCPPEIQAVYGEKPRMIEILFPNEDPTTFFKQRLMWYKGSRLICRGNNEVATRVNEQTGEMFEMECPCEMLKTPENPKGPCDLRANLMVIVPRVSISGCYQIDTSSLTAIDGINNYIEYLKNAVYRIGFVPLHLVREEETVQYVEASGAVKAGKRWIVKVRLPKDIDYARLAAFRDRDIISIEGGEQIKVRPALPPAPVDDGDDASPGSVIEEENGENGGEEVPQGDQPAPATEPEVVNGDQGPQEEEKEELPFEEDDPEPPISQPRQSIMIALLKSKGYKTPQEADTYTAAKFGYTIDTIPASKYETIKEEITKLPNRK